MNTTIAKRLGWVIDVCRRCGREAKWPFCAHRDEPCDGKWYMTITVTTTPAQERQLLAGMDPSESR